MWNAPFRPSEWVLEVLEVGRTKPVNVWRYSDAVVLISQLSKSCSCGIRTDTVPVGDLGGGRGGGRWGGKEREEAMKKIIIPTKVCIDFTCPDHEAG